MASSEMPDTSVYLDDPVPADGGDFRGSGGDETGQPPDDSTRFDRDCSFDGDDIFDPTDIYESMEKSGIGQDPTATCAQWAFGQQAIQSTISMVMGNFVGTMMISILSASPRRI